MVNRLPVRSDHRNLSQRDSKLPASSERRARKKLAESEIELSNPRGGRHADIRDSKNLLAHRPRIGHGVKSLKSREKLRWRTGNALECNIDPVRGRPRHQAKHILRLASCVSAFHRSCFLSVARRFRDRKSVV